MIIGLPTLRLRGDYIAIVTLAFGEIIGTLVVNGGNIHLWGGQTLTAGNLGISALDLPYFPVIGKFGLLSLRPWYWLILAIAVIVLFVVCRLRDSRLGRAWIALREDEVAAVSMGIPLVKTKLLAYAIGAAFGGMSGVFLADFDQTVNASQFQFTFSIFVLSMVIVGGLGSIPGRRARRAADLLHQLLPDPGRAEHAAAHLRPQLRPDRPEHRDLRLPARDRDGAAPAGPVAGATPQTRAVRATWRPSRPSSPSRPRGPASRSWPTVRAG